MTVEAKVVFEDREYTLKAPWADDWMYHSAIQQGRFFEHPLLTYVSELRLEGAYVDVGASLGNHSVFFLNECPCESLIAIEPVDDLLEALRDNIQANNPRETPATVIHRAASHSDSAVACWVLRQQNSGATCMRVYEEGDERLYRPDMRRTPCVTLDTAVPADAKVAFVKVDVETSEPIVLMGATRLLTSQRPVLCLSVRDAADIALLDALLGPYRYQRMNNTPLSGQILWRPC